MVSKDIREMMIKIGDLVKEKEGKRHCGLVIDVKENKATIQWPNGTSKLHEIKFLEKF